MARDPRGGPLIPTPADAVPDDEAQFDPDGVQHELRAARVLPERGFADVNDFLRRLYRDNIRHKINVKYLNGKTYEEILELIQERVSGPASSTVCNLPCFAATDGKSIQDTGISSSNILTSGRDSATPALDDLFGFWDDNDSGNPKKATLTALKTALGVGGGNVTANGSDGGDFPAAGFLIQSDGNNKVISDTGITVDGSNNVGGVGTLGSGQHTITQSTTATAVQLARTVKVSAATDPTSGLYHGDTRITNTAFIAAVENIDIALAASSKAMIVEVRAGMVVASNVGVDGADPDTGDSAIFTRRGILSPSGWHETFAETDEHAGNNATILGSFTVSRSGDNLRMQCQSVQPVSGTLVLDVHAEVRVLGPLN